MSSDNIVFLDTETTGTDMEHDRIIEIGAIKCNSEMQIVGEFKEYVNNEGRHLPVGAVRVHKIYYDKVENAPRFVEIIDKLMAFVKDCKIVMHNSKFDTNMLDAAMKRCKKQSFSSQVDAIYDTMLLKDEWGYSFTGNSLNAFCNHFGIELGDRVETHGALIDSKLLMQVFVAMKNSKQHTIEFSQKQTDNSKAPRSDNIDSSACVAVVVTEEEMEAHNAYLQKIQPQS